MIVFNEIVEKKLNDPRGKLTQLIKYTTDSEFHSVTCRDWIWNCQTFAHWKISWALENYSSLQKGNQTLAPNQSWQCCCISEIPELLGEVWKYCSSSELECLGYTRHHLYVIVEAFRQCLVMINDLIINPFVPNAPFLYPLKTSENHKVND